tara:strand:- start:158 stop:349 length:192 start_codon:yes stop_codon:yes gene_type:complete
MSDNPFVPKPIEEVKKDIHTIKLNLNTIKIDVVCIKSEIQQIKELLKIREDQKEEISKGWFFN